jgi:uncharacterized protein (DUF58 family)
MSRLLPLLRSLYTRLQRLWLIERPNTGGRAAIALCHPLVLVVFIFILIWYIARPSAVAVVATVGLGGMLTGGYLWARQMALGLSARRRLHYAAVQVGDEIEEIVAMTNTSALPVLWAEFNDHSNIPGYSLSSVRAIGGNASLEWRVHATCTLRGNYRFGPWELLTGDPFGLFKVTLTYAQQEEILVYPPLAALPEQIIPRGRALGDDRSLHQPLQAESMSAFGTRPYVPGDPLRHIHWATTARQPNPYVKIFDPEASSTLWLIPDLDSGVQQGSGPDSTLETMITLLASLADRLLNERLAVGIIACTESPTVVVPARGRPHLWQLLRVLAGLQTTPRPLSETLAQARSLISGRERVVVVTPSLQPDWAGELNRLGPNSRSSNAEVILLDPGSFSMGANLGEEKNPPLPPLTKGGKNPPLPPLITPLREREARGGKNPPTLTPFVLPSGSAKREGGQGGILNAAAFVSFLASQGIPARVLRQGDIRPHSGSYGEVSRWEFKTLGTGRAIARHAPRLKIDEALKKGETE